MATPLPETQARFDFAELVAVTGAEVRKRGEATPLCGVTTDSRRAGRGMLFVAVSGSRHDGHDHVGDAAEAGATAALVERPVRAPSSMSLLQVDSCVQALGALAATHRRRFGIPVVAITGSVGKTSTKELAAAVFSRLGLSVLSTRGNLNNRLGAPLTLLSLDRHHDVAVIELGMSVPNEIADLAKITAPTVGVVTAVAQAHTEGVGSLEAVAREKGALLDALGPDAVAIYTADDAPLAPYVERCSAGTQWSFGRAAGASARLISWSLTPSARTRVRYAMNFGPQAQVDLELGLLGAGAALNGAATLALVEAVLPGRSAEAARALGSVPPTEGRMVPMPGPGGTLIIDDTYNASPRSVSSALETGAALAAVRKGRLIAVLGDMLELGERAPELHAEVGREALRSGVWALVTVGDLMMHAAHAAGDVLREDPGERGASVSHLDDAASAAALVEGMAREGDVILVKGSRGMRLERLAEALSEGRALREERAASEGRGL